MVHGIGVDLVEVERIRKAIERRPRFVERVYTSGERDYCHSKARPFHHFAARFAAKEAIMKALGTGMRGVSWQEMEISGDAAGRPEAILTGKAAVAASEQGISEILVSLSMTGSQAVACVVAVAVQRGSGAG